MRREQITKIHELAIRSGVSSAVYSWDKKLSVPDARDKLGNSLLMLAVKYGQKDLVTYFIKSGVSLQIRNNSGMSAADLALKHGFSAIHELLCENKNLNQPVYKEDHDSKESQSLNFEDDQTINGWSSEPEAEPPEHDEELEDRASDIIQQFHIHKPIDHAKVWSEIKLTLPIQNYQDIDKVSNFPSIQKLVSFCISNDIPVPQELYVEAIADDEMSFGSSLPDFFWEELPNRIGFSLQPSWYGSISEQDIFRRYSPDPELDSTLIVTDALEQSGELEKLWTDRYATQFLQRDVIDRHTEERLGQRMDSSLLAIRHLTQNPDHQHAIEHLKSKCMAFETNEECVNQEGGDTNEETSSDEELVSTDSKLSPFFCFIAGDRSLSDEGFPPRPSHEDIVLITNVLKEIDPKLLEEITLHYGRYLSARNQFFLSNLRLVVSTAKKYRKNHNLTLEDHVQNGLLGLLKAVERYNYRLGFKFSTYSTWWIKQNITREIANQSNTIRIPVHVHASQRKFERAIAEQHGADIDEQALEDSTGLSTKEIEKIKKTFHSPINIDDLDDMSPEDLNYIETSSIEEPFNKIYAVELKNLVKKVVELLTPKESEVIQMRFGLEGHEESTLEQIGQLMGVTRERIRQIEAGALRKLRKRFYLQHFDMEAPEGLTKHDDN